MFKEISTELLNIDKKFESLINELETVMEQESRIENLGPSG